MTNGAAAASAVSATNAVASVVTRFGNFELVTNSRSPAAAELRRGGVFVKLSPQPMLLLQLLLEHAGELVSREEIQRKVWGDQTFVDFDRNLNVCVAQLRAALHDDAEAPRFIRTIPKRGYLFLQPVERVTPMESSSSVELAPVPAPVVRWNFALVAIFVLVALGSIAAAWILLRKPLPTPLTSRVMIAVLPFDGDDGAISDGLLDEVISNIGTLSSSRLAVIARSSVMRFKKPGPDLKQVGRELNVQYAIEGTVRRDGQRLRVTARLIDLADQSSIWTDVYEDDDANLSKLEQSASAGIAAGVARRLFPQLIVARAKAHVPNREAFDAYRTGRSLQTQGTHAALQRSLASFESAVQLDAKYAEAYAALADSCVSLARSGDPPKVMFPRAAEAASKALELDETSAEAHNALGNVRFWHDWNWAAAEQQFARALTINPSYAAAHHDYAWYLVAMGRTEQSLISLRRAIALDPLSVRVNIDAGWLLQQAHRFQEAVVQARHAQELDPGLEEAKSCIERAEFFLGRNRQAPAAGRNPYAVAVHFAATGEKQAALDALEQAFAERAMMMPLVNVDPAFTNLQTESRFQRLAGQMKYP